MLAQLSARLRARQTAGGAGGGEGDGEGEGLPIMIDDNCEVSSMVLGGDAVANAEFVTDHVAYIRGSTTTEGMRRATWWHCRRILRGIEIVLMCYGNGLDCFTL